MKKNLLFILTMFSVAVLSAVEERDWLNNLVEKPLPHTETLIPINLDALEGSKIAITYALDGGRFGDQLLNYLKALWISWKYDLPLLYRPFDHSEELLLSTFQTYHFSEETARSFSHKIEFLHYTDSPLALKIFEHLENGQEISPTQNVLWSIGLLTPLIEERFTDKLNDKHFRSFIQNQIQPKEKLSLSSLPNDRITVALHLRTGVGYDLEVNIRNMPTKFPPLSFYLSGLKQIANHFKNEPLYVHIFTDHPNPSVLREALLEKFPQWEIENDIILHCRLSENHHTLHVLEDLFDMMQFDCLIHPDSSFSHVVSIVSGPVLEIKPSNWGECRKNPLDDSLIVDPLVMHRKEKGGDLIKQKIVPINYCEK